MSLNSPEIPGERSVPTDQEGLTLTLLQALSALWRQKLLVLSAIVLAAVAAGFYLHSEKASYASTARVQLPAGKQQDQASAVSPSLQLITSDHVVEAAAQSLKGKNAAELSHEVKGSFNTDTDVVSITATTPVAADAAPVANAFAEAYLQALSTQASNVVSGLLAQQNTLAEQIATLTAQSKANPTDLVLKTKLSNITFLFGTVSTQLFQAQSAPASGTILNLATGGASTAHSKSKVLGIAAAIGLIAGCGIALLRAQFDTRLRSSRQIEALVGRPVLAELPYVRGYRRGSTALAVIDSPHSLFAESIRELRTSTAVLLASTETPVLVVTSPAPLDGKTLVTANLAASWALSGKRTILVGGDLRRPRVQDFFGSQESDTGLCELLARQTASADDTQSLLRKTAVEDLLFLPAGHPHSDPADTLASPAMARLVAQLRNLADIIVIDAPPVLACSDATICGGLADGVIVVVRATKTRDKDLGETAKRLGAGNVRILGTALNRLKRVERSAYSYYDRSDAKTNGRDQLEDGDFIARPRESGQANRHGFHRNS